MQKDYFLHNIFQKVNEQGLHLSENYIKVYSRGRGRGKYSIRNN